MFLFENFKIRRDLRWLEKTFRIHQKMHTCFQIAAIEKHCKRQLLFPARSLQYNGMQIVILIVFAMCLTFSQDQDNSSYGAFIQHFDWFFVKQQQQQQPKTAS